MHTSSIVIVTLSLAASLSVLGCGATAVPTAKLATAQSAEQSASELGAASQPKAKLHLQLAHEQIAQATVAMKDGDNERATGLLLRAQADAELAIALTRDQSATSDAQKATGQANVQQTVNANQASPP